MRNIHKFKFRWVTHKLVQNFGGEPQDILTIWDGNERLICIDTDHRDIIIVIIIVTTTTTTTFIIIILLLLLLHLLLQGLQSMMNSVLFYNCLPLVLIM